MRGKLAPKTSRRIAQRRQGQIGKKIHKFIQLSGGQSRGLRAPLPRIELGGIGDRRETPDRRVAAKERRSSFDRRRSVSPLPTQAERRLIGERRGRPRE